jgi:chemotaxis protein methyltransferase CheR
MPPPTSETRLLSPKQLELVQRIAYDSCGLDLSRGKEALIESRLTHHMREKGVMEVREYLQMLDGGRNREMLDGLLSHLTTNHTYFFREPSHITYFEQRICAPLANSNERLFVWSAASSSGEEPYSLAIAAWETLGPEAARKVRILATDISLRMLERARKGIYPAEALASLPPALRQRHFSGAGLGGRFQIKSELRAMVAFRRLNLIEPLPSFPPADVIFCRNVMIYFDAPTRAGVVTRLIERLRPGGYFFVGHSETLGLADERLGYLEPSAYRRL